VLHGVRRRNNRHKLGRKKKKEVLTGCEGKLFPFEDSQALKQSMQKGCAISIHGSL